VTLIEGRSNQIRKMFKYFGLMVEKLRRTQIGFLKLGNLAPTQWRPLTAAEVKEFYKLLKLPAK
jgi:23S rRNA pseudouridine2605 synthase